MCYNFSSLFTYVCEDFTVYFRRTIKLDARVANLILYYSNVNVLRNDNNVARVKSKRIETSICSIINIELSTPIFGLPMFELDNENMIMMPSKRCSSIKLLLLTFVSKFIYLFEYFTYLSKYFKYFLYFNIMS